MAVPSNHHFVFADSDLKTYPARMRFRSRRRFVAVVTAVLFVFSALVHGFVASTMVAEGGMTADGTMGGMAMQAAAADMTSHDDDAMHDDATPCPASLSGCSRDIGVHMACFAHCATVLGIVSDPVLVPVTMVGDKLTLAVVHPLPGLHGPPEPHPPKPLVLI